MSHKCTIRGCGWEFVDKKTALLHSANTWHCILCGKTNGVELTVENCTDACDDCRDDEKKCQYIRVDFKRKIYSVKRKDKGHVLVAKEYGKWVHYE